MIASTLFAAYSLALLPFDPPAPKRGDRYGRGERCWLCGGATNGAGWPQAIAIAPTFTQHNLACCGASDAVCQACAATMAPEAFQAMVRARNLPLKTWAQCGWHSYSHFIRDTGAYEAPVPSRSREIMLDPPPGWWLLALNTTGKKHTIFRARVATERGRFPVQVDEDTLWVRHAEYRACLAAFERLTALGCGKDGVETGRYHPADTMRAGLAPWREAEDAMAPWRERAPGLVGLVRLVARSAKAQAQGDPVP